MISYETNRLILRNYQLKDIEDYYEYMSLESTAMYEDFLPYTLGECEKAVAGRLSNDEFWIVELKENGKAIGDLCYRWGDYQTYEIAFDFNEKYTKKGYATEACRVLIRHIFTLLNARRISVGCNEENVSSWQLLERLGFRREAHCIEDVFFKVDTDLNPIYVNSYFYALLKKEWEHTESA